VPRCGSAEHHDDDEDADDDRDPGLVRFSMVIFFATFSFHRGEMSSHDLRGSREAAALSV
jgi:hypothetical protein